MPEMDSDAYSSACSGVRRKIQEVLHEFQSAKDDAVLRYSPNEAPDKADYYESVAGELKSIAEDMSRLGEDESVSHEVRRAALDEVRERISKLRKSVLERSLGY